MKKILWIFFFLPANIQAQNVPSYVPKCGLAAWYPFSGNAEDSGGHEHNGTVHGATLTTDRFGHPHAAYSFNGINNFIYIPSGEGGNGLDISGSISISAWVKSVNYAHDSWEQIFWRGDLEGAHDSYMLYVNSRNLAFRRDVETGVTSNEIDYPITNIDTLFHHFAGTYDSVSGDMCVYFDGSLVSKINKPGPENYPTAHFWNVVGAVDNGNWQFFLGSIDDIGVWNRVLSPCEISNLYYAVDHSCGDTTITNIDINACDKKSLTLNGPDGFSFYVWNTGSTAPSISVDTNGIYWVSASNDDCGKVAIDTIREIVSSPVINLGNDTTLCTGNKLRLQLPADEGQYLWSDGSTGQDLDVTSAGTYWLTATNQCGSTSDTININYSFCNLVFPSAFTPNGDGKNDVIRVIGSVAEFADFSLSIFNRFGQRVFYTQDIYAGWDGTFNGKQQDLGTYYYMIAYSFNSRKNMMKGDFELIR